jgi:hypothetical protein
MVLWDIFDALSPHARVATAVLPFVGAMILRVLVGRTMLTRYAISFTTLWFLVNVLLAPYSTGMTDDLQAIRGFFR